MTAVLALVVAGALFPLWIRLLRFRNIGQQVRADGPQGHLVKQGTPTMGGVLILLVVVGIYLAMGRVGPLRHHRAGRDARVRAPRLRRRLREGAQGALARADAAGEDAVADAASRSSSACSR